MNLNNPRPLLFLDIDGVLTNANTGFRYGDALCVALLNFITETTGAAIVVSSTWRRDPNIAVILASWGVTGKVIGITPFLDQTRASGIGVAVERGTEIARWIAQNDPAGTFVILDDDSDMGELRRFLVQTKSTKGLTHYTAAKAVLMLQNCDHPCRDYFIDKACACTQRRTAVEQAASTVVANAINAQPFACGDCGWQGPRRELVWSVPRCYICPACKSNNIQRVTDPVQP